MADETSVYIDALTTFGTQLYFHDSMTVGAGLSAPSGDMSSAMVGAVGTDEAQTFAAWNAGILEAFGYFVRDTALGYPSLGGVAIIVASNYRQGDLSQADAMTDVMDAFNPAAGTKTIADIDKQKPPVVTPPKGSADGLPDPTQCTINGQPPKPNSPFAKWQAHQDRYQKWETWRPIEPDPSPQQKPTPPSQTPSTTPPSSPTPSPSNSHRLASPNSSTQSQTQPPTVCKPSK